MKRLRTHIIRFVVTLLICSGFSLSLVQPVQAKHSTGAFADWLTTMAKASDKADLQQELEQLRQSNDHFDKVIQQASQIVSNNNDEFSFSLSEAMASQQLYQILLIEWSQFQTGNAMSSVPVQQTVKSLIPVKADKDPLVTSASLALERIAKKTSDLQSFLPQKSFFLCSPIPMASGIAIGAP